jgi:hypothetical protein
MTFEVILALILSLGKPFRLCSGIAGLGCNAPVIGFSAYSDARSKFIARKDY